MDIRRHLLKQIKKRRSFFSFLPSFKSFLSGKSLFLVIFIILFTLSLILFARFEFITQPVIEQMKSEGKNPYFEAFYWLITTAATVGYGDITPRTFNGKVIAITVMILGVSLLGFLLSQLTQSIVASNIGKFFGISRITKSIDFVICGWNDLAKAAFEEINDFRSSIIIISPSRPDIDLSNNIQYISGDPCDKSVLGSANIQKAKHILLCMDDDSEVLLAAHVIRELNPWVNITAAISNSEYISMAESAGADQVIAPSAIAGRLLSIISERPYVVKWFLDTTSKSMHGKYIEYFVAPNSLFAGKSLSAIRQLHALRVIGVESEGGFDKLPHGDYELKPGDRLVVMVEQ